jgi:HlyD family secretion protein
MHPNPRRILPVVVLLAIAALVGWWWQNNQAAAQTGDLSASGTIEATQVEVAAEIGGRITAVNAAEGDHVTAGAPLVTLDDTLLRAQRDQALAALAQAQAGLAGAQARLDQAKAGARPDAVAAAQARVDQARAYYERVKQGPTPAQLAAAQATVNSAASAYTAAVKSAGATDMQLAASQAALDKAAADLKVAQQNYDLVAWFPSVSALPQSQALQYATIAYQQAEANYGAQLVTSQPSAQSRVVAAAAQLAQARATLDQLEHPAIENDLAAAQAAIDMAQAQLDDLRAGPTAEDLAVLQAGVDQAQGAIATAQASVDLLDVQIAKLTIAAPLDGTVLARSAEPGELAVPGGALLTIADLEHLTITVYVPEDRYGQVRLGARAELRVDSYPGEVFGAAVVHVADQAEFTPRNVQTPGGRKTTVFAVKLSIDNPGGRLKPGMPADVTFVP